MDPLQWCWRYYLCQAIEKVGFDQGWGAIREQVRILSQAFQKTDFTLNDTQCHLFYLQMLAEFGDFRSFSDELTPPSPEILAKITRMRRSELRHELIMTNNQMRYNNYILKHHGQPITRPDLKWRRIESTGEITEEPGFLVHIVAQCRLAEWYKLLPQEGKGPYGLKNMSMDAIMSRCIAGVVRTPMELMRDIFHFIVNVSLGKVSPGEQAALAQLREFAVEKLGPFLENDATWAKVRCFIEETGDED
jgi:hypothetical protein